MRNCNCMFVYFGVVYVALAVAAYFAGAIVIDKAYCTDFYAFTAGLLSFPIVFYLACACDKRIHRIEHYLLLVSGVLLFFVLLIKAIDVRIYVGIGAMASLLLVSISFTNRISAWLCFDNKFSWRSLCKALLFSWMIIIIFSFPFSLYFAYKAIHVDNVNTYNHFAMGNLSLSIISFALVHIIREKI